MFSNIQMGDISPQALVSLFVSFIVALHLIPVIMEISSAKRIIVISIISTGLNTDSGWELKLIFFAIAFLVVVSIPTWGLLKIVFQT